MQCTICVLGRPMFRPKIRLWTLCSDILGYAIHLSLPQTQTKSQQPVIFVTLYVSYKIKCKTSLIKAREMGLLWYVRDELEDLEGENTEAQSRFWSIVSFLR